MYRRVISTLFIVHVEFQFLETHLLGQIYESWLEKQSKLIYIVLY